MVLHTLSERYGYRSFIVKNATRVISHFQPLSILYCEISENPKSQLWSAGDFSEFHPLAAMRSSLGKNAISMFMAEVLYRSLREGADEPGLFDWCVSEILLLDALQSDFSNFHIRFLLDFASAMGFQPSYDDLLPFLESSAIPVMSMMEKDFADSMLVPLQGSMRSEICTRLIKYLEMHLEQPLNIRSLQVLGELF